MTAIGRRVLRIGQEFSTGPPSPAHHVLLAEDMRVNQSEWWHWSSGDQHWAYQTGAAATLHDEVH